MSSSLRNLIRNNQTDKLSSLSNNSESARLSIFHACAICDCILAIGSGPVVLHRGELDKEREWVKQGGGHHQGKPLTASRTRHCSVRSSLDGSSQPVALQLFQVEPLKLPPSPILLHAALSYQIKKVSINAKILLLSYWEQLSWESLYKSPHQQAK